MSSSQKLLMCGGRDDMLLYIADTLVSCNTWPIKLLIVFCLFTFTASRYSWLHWRPQQCKVLWPLQLLTVKYRRRGRKLSQLAGARLPFLYRSRWQVPDKNESESATTFNFRLLLHLLIFHCNQILTSRQKLTCMNYWNFVCLMKPDIEEVYKENTLLL